MANKKVLDKTLSHQNLKAICRLRPSLADCAAFFDVSEDTIQNRCKEYEGATFSVVRDKYMADTRLKLVKQALNMAMLDKNTAMMIFCLKNINKWQDKFEIDVEHTVTDFTSWAKEMSKKLEEEEAKQIDVTPKKDE